MWILTEMPHTWKNTTQISEKKCHSLPVFSTVKEKEYSEQKYWRCLFLEHKWMH